MSLEVIREYLVARYTAANDGRQPCLAGEILIGQAANWMRHGRCVGFTRVGDAIFLEVYRPKQAEVSSQ